MVLFVSKSRRDAVTAADLFKLLNIVAYGANQAEALKEIAPRYHAVVLIDPEKFPDHIDFIKLIHSYQREMPIFALTDRPDLLPHPELFADIESNNVRSAEYAYKMYDCLSRMGKPPIGIYNAGEVRSVCDMDHITYYGIRLDFTKMESAIIRFIMANHPFPQSTAQIIKYVYPRNKKPEEATVRTHISVINRKFKALFPSIDFILHVPHKGYKIKTPSHFEF